MDRRLHELVATMQDVLSKQVPLYSKVQEVSRWFATASFEIPMNYSPDWKVAMKELVAPQAAAADVPIARVLENLKIMDKDGGDLTGKVLTPPEDEEPFEVPEELFPLT